MLPYLELVNMYNEISPDSKGGADNWNPAQQIVDVFVCPSANPQSSSATTLKVSNYSTVAGAGRKPDDVKDLEDNLCGDVYTDGAFYPGSETRTSEIGDGTSKTLAIGERTYIFREWMFGSSKAGGVPPKRICSGSSHNIRYPLNANPLELEDGFYKFDNAAPVGAIKKMLLNDLFFGSEHPGGAQFNFADGSVHMFRDDTSPVKDLLGHMRKLAPAAKFTVCGPCHETSFPVKPTLAGAWDVFAQEVLPGSNEAG